jgi:hypothetical protein
MTPIYAFVPLATVVYLLVDLYPAVKSFSAIVRTPSFILLWVVYSILNTIAFAALKLAAGPKILALLGDQTLATLTVIILSTLSTLTILQSFTLKIADYKFIDIGLLMEAYRKRVLEDIAGTVIKGVRLEEQKLSDRLFAKYQANAQKLRAEYVLVMTFGGGSPAQIGAELTQLQQDAQTNQITFEQLVALRIVKTDPDRARELLR